MQDYQFITIIAANLGVFLTFMGIAVGLHLSNRRRIDEVSDRELKKDRRKING